MSPLNTYALGFIRVATVPTVDFGDWLCKMLGICA
jgi:hypothetical protein